MKKIFIGIMFFSLFAWADNSSVKALAADICEESESVELSVNGYNAITGVKGELDGCEFDERITNLSIPGKDVVFKEHDCLKTLRIGDVNEHTGLTDLVFQLKNNNSAHCTASYPGHNIVHRKAENGYHNREICFPLVIKYQQNYRQMHEE